MVDDALSFLKAIEAEPSCIGHRLVYADWLEENGLFSEAKRQRVIANLTVRNRLVSVTRSVTRTDHSSFQDSFTRVWLERELRRNVFDKFFRDLAPGRYLVDWGPVEYRLGVGQGGTSVVSVNPEARMIVLVQEYTEK